MRTLTIVLLLLTLALVRFIYSLFSVFSYLGSIREVFQHAYARPFPVHFHRTTNPNNLSPRTLPFAEYPSGFGDAFTIEKDSFLSDTFSKMEVRQFKSIMHTWKVTSSPTCSFYEPCFSVSFSFFFVFCSVTVCLDLWLSLKFLRLLFSATFSVTFYYLLSCLWLFFLWLSCDFFFLLLCYLSFLMWSFLFCDFCHLLLGQYVLVSVARKFLIYLNFLC